MTAEWVAGVRNSMHLKSTRAAILTQSRAPLVVDEIALPDALDAGQVLVRVLYTTICGAQINEIDAAKGPDKFLPHLLGHEASAEVLEIGPGVTSVKPGDSVVLHWRPSQGIQSRTLGRGTEFVPSDIPRDLDKSTS